jgi:ATP/maltotriose-dependent transcriptional regulator MalT
MAQQLAKITPPRAPGAIRRPWLWARLDGIRRSGGVVWVSGPPGFGKTTLLASWIAERRIRPVWLRVDSGDVEAATLLDYLAEAARAGRRRPLRLPVLAPGLDVEIFARSFCRALLAALPRRAVIVLDDLGEVPADAPLDLVLRTLVEELPRGATLLLVSRGAPPPVLARAGVTGALHRIRAPELELTLSESRAIARRRGITDRARAEVFHRAAQGWAAGLVLMLARDEATAVWDEPAAAFDYFAGEVFDRADPGTRRVLLELALLEAPTATLAVRATGDPAAARILASFARRGLFTLRHDGDDPAFEFHALFRAFLLRRGREELQPGRAAEVRRAAAAALAPRGGDDAAAAGALLVEAGAFEESARLAVREAPALLASGRSRVVEGWIARLPLSLREHDPWLLLWGGAALVGRDHEGARERLERALALFEERGDAAGFWLSWAAVVEATLHAWTDFAHLARRLDELDLLSRRLPIPPGEIEVRVRMAALAALVHHAPDHPALHELGAAAEALALGDGDVRGRLIAGALFQLYSVWWFGDVARARPVVEALRPLARTRDIEPLAAIQWLAMEAPYYVAAGEDAAGASAAQEARRLAEASGVHAWDVVLHSQAIWGALGTDDVSAARGHVEQVAAAARAGNAMDRALVRGFQAATSLRDGLALAALRQAEEAKALGEKHCHPVVHVLADLLLARAHVRAGTGATPEAEVAFASAREKIGRIGTGAFAHVLALAEADRATRAGDLEAAVAALARAVPLAHLGAAHASYFFSRPELADLLALALERGVHPEAVRTLIRSRGLLPPAHAGPEWPWSVRISALGPFEIEREGTLLETGSRAIRKPLELLKALVALGGRDVRGEVLADAVWPDAEGDAAHHALETTLYRLRRFLGAGAVLAGDRRLSVAPDGCFVDALELDRRLRTATAALERPGGPDPLRAREDAAAIVGLYRGPLLAGEQATWATEVRARLRKRLTRWLEAAAELPGDPAGAGASAARLRAVDPELSAGRAALRVA